MNTRPDIPLKSEQLDEIAPGVRRLVARNPGVMTGPGTNTYIVGRGPFVVIDPGPVDEVHIQRVLALTDGNISAVLATHTHPDHSPAAGALVAATGARVLGMPAPAHGPQDASFQPGQVLNDGDVVTVGDMRLRALHTPGHASNHLCYLLEDVGLLFTGDHLMQGSTVVISPPDGDMALYLQSLARLQSEPVVRIAPGHGLVIEDAQWAIDYLIKHRLRREAKVLERLQQLGDATLPVLVRSVYDDVDERLHPVARASLLAHLLKLAAEGKVVRDGEIEESWSINASSPPRH